MTQGMQAPLERKRRQTILPWSLQEGSALPTLHFRTPGPQAAGEDACVA